MSNLFEVSSLKISPITSQYAPRWISQTYTVDLDGDGADDYLVLGGTYPGDNGPVAQPGLMIFGDGKGGFSLAANDRFPWERLQTVHPREVSFADFNGDGILDVFIANHGWDTNPFPGEQNLLFLSDKNGTWRDATSNLPSLSDFSHGSAVGDVNGDGAPDIVVVNTTQPNPWLPYVMLNDGSGNFTRAENLLPTQPGGILAVNYQRLTAAQLADLNQDGRVDLIIGPAFSTNSAPRPVQILWNTGTGFSQGPVTSLPLPSQSGATYLTYEIQAMDVNFDGLMDLIIAYQRDVLLGGWELQVLENQGAQQFVDKTAFYIPDASARSNGIPSQENKQSQQWVQFIRLADLNNDGRMDFTLDSRGITTAPPNLPVAYLHQADGTFVVATASQLAPDMGWFFDYSTQYARWDGHGGFVRIGIENGETRVYALPVEFKALEPAWQGFSNPVALLGGSRNDTLYGGLGNDTLKGLQGDDVLNGGGGLDKALFSGAISQFNVSWQEPGRWKVIDQSGAEGSDTLIQIERVHFSDKGLALDIEGHAGTAAKVLGAVFGRSSVTNSEYAGIAISLLDGGMSYEQLMGLAINARLGASASHKEIVELLYINVAGVGPSAQEREHFEGLLGNGTFSVAALGVLAADTDLNQANIDLVGLAKSGLQFDLI